MVTVPTAPANLTATAGSGQVTLSWTGVSGATSYDLYREVSGGGYFITNITDTTYTGKRDPDELQIREAALNRK